MQNQQDSGITARKLIRCGGSARTSWPPASLRFDNRRDLLTMDDKEFEELVKKYGAGSMRVRIAAALRKHRRPLSGSASPGQNPSKREVEEKHAGSPAKKAKAPDQGPSAVNLGSLARSRMAEEEGNSPPTRKKRAFRVGRKLVKRMQRPEIIKPKYNMEFNEAREKKGRRRSKSENPADKDKSSDSISESDAEIEQGLEKPEINPGGEKDYARELLNLSALHPKLKVDEVQEAWKDLRLTVYIHERSVELHDALQTVEAAMAKKSFAKYVRRTTDKGSQLNEMEEAKKLINQEMQRMMCGDKEESTITDEELIEANQLVLEELQSVKL